MHATATETARTDARLSTLSAIPGTDRRNAHTGVTVGSDTRLDQEHGGRKRSSV